MPEIPDWVEYTPALHDYELAIWIEGDSQQSIVITRAEYIALKKHLAAMRGYTLGDFRERIEKLKTEAPAGWENEDSQQNARHLQAARAWYRSRPDLVVFESAEMDAHIAELADW